MPATAPQIRKTASFRAQQDSTLEVRNETFQGRDYLVVPVIALVEGVLQAMNAATPELALAEEFGKVPDSWNGRPIVMNHPVIDGTPVSANSTAVLEEYQFGFIFNSKVEDSKLKVEAWLDTERVKELGGEIESTVERIQAGDLVEVSTGLFTATEQKKGRFAGRNYSAIWRNILPDHLAFLSEGTLGACSGEDGCGVRANTSPAWGEFIMPEPADDETTPAMKTMSNDKATILADVDTGTITFMAEQLKDVDCGCDGKPVIMTNAKGEEISVEHNEFAFVANSIPEGLVDQDVRKLLSQAIRAIKPYSGYGYVIHFTASKVIYETYGYDSGVYYDGYTYYQRSYSIDESNNVTLGDDIERVNLLTQVVPVTTTEATLNANSGDPVMTEKPNTPAGTPETPTAVVPPAATESAPTVPEVVEPTVTANAAPKIKTMAEFIAEAPPEYAEIVQSGIRMHNQKKQSVIKSLKDSGRCKFDDTYLNAQKLETLEAMAELAAIPTYEGLAPSVRDNSANDDQTVPAMPRMSFGAPKTA